MIWRVIKNRIANNDPPDDMEKLVLVVNAEYKSVKFAHWKSAFEKVQRQEDAFCEADDDPDLADDAVSSASESDESDIERIRHVFIFRENFSFSLQ